MGATPRLPMDNPIQWFRKIEADIRLLREQMGNLLAGSGLSVPSTGVTQVDQTFNVVGTQNVSGNLNVTGSATIGGPTTISGTTTVSGTNGIQSSNFVPGSTGWNLTGTSIEIDTGAIGNSALVHPISFDGNGGAATNFAVATTGASSVLLSVTNTVPAGMTKMASFVTSNVTAINSTASLDYLQSRVGITSPGGTSYAGNSGYAPVGASGGSQQVSASKYGILTGLAGGQTVTHYLNVWSSSANWAANASNIADLQALILWGA